MVWRPDGLPPGEQGSREIQLPFYDNRFETIWEYKAAFLSGRIDFFSFLGSACPICGESSCYRQITSYYRYAIDRFPKFKKEKIPIARFLRRRQKRTFSLLPIQLIPYFQYTVAAVMGTLVLGLKCFQMGQQGFFGATLKLDPDSLVTPWLVAFWIKVILQGFRKNHFVLARFFDLSHISTRPRRVVWPEFMGYLTSLGYQAKARAGPQLLDLFYRVSRITGQFLFGTPSQHRFRVVR